MYVCHRWVSTFLAASAGSIHYHPYIHRQHAIHTSSYPMLSYISYTYSTYICKHAKHIAYMPTYIHTYLRISCLSSIREAGIEPVIVSPNILKHTYSHTYMNTRHKQGGHICMTVCMWIYVCMVTSCAGSMDGNTQICMYVRGHVCNLSCKLMYVCTVCVWYVRDMGYDDVCMACCWLCMYGG